MTVPLRVKGTRVLIEPDREDLSPQETPSGLYTARSLGAAVTGQDEAESWYSGTVVALGDGLTGPFDVRAFVLRRLQEFIDSPLFHCTPTVDVWHLQREIEALPVDAVCDLTIGDAVTFASTAGQTIVLDGTPYLILDVHDILGVLSPEPQQEYDHVG